MLWFDPFTLAKVCQQKNWQVQPSRLMRLHFHREVETPQANLVVGMRRLPRAYPIRRMNLSGTSKAKVHPWMPANLKPTSAPPRPRS